MSFKNYDPEIFECYCFPKDCKEHSKYENKDPKEYKKPEYKEPKEYWQPEYKEPHRSDDCKDFYEFYCFWKEYYECFCKYENKDSKYR